MTWCQAWYLGPAELFFIVCKLILSPDCGGSQYLTFHNTGQNDDTMYLTKLRVPTTAWAPDRTVIHHLYTIFTFHLLQAVKKENDVSISIFLQKYFLKISFSPSDQYISLYVYGRHTASYLSLEKQPRSDKASPDQPKRILAGNAVLDLTKPVCVLQTVSRTVIVLR